jgi:hypothetical protein
MRYSAHRRIHKKLRKHTPKSIEKVKKIFSFRYPKLFILIIVIFFAYYLFSQPFISEWMMFFNKLGNFGVFISGILTAFGFTAPVGIGLLIKIIPKNVLFAALLAGFGATISDLLIFKTIKISFMDEFKKLEKTKLIQEIEHIVKKNKHVLIRHYLLYIFAGIVLATPLPDELGVSMLAGLTTIKPIRLAIISFMLHSFTIFLILSFL